MRVTHNMLMQTALRDIRNSMAGLSRFQEQVASGKKLSRPSDDPFAVERALAFRAELRALEACRRNIELADDWLSATDTTLEKLSDIVVRARNVGIRGADDSLDAQARGALAAEAAQLLGSALQAVNTTVQGRFLFAGYRSDEPPFVGLDNAGQPTQNPQAIASIQYVGDDGAMIRALEPGVTLTINITGAEPWLDPAEPGSLLNVLLQLRDALQANDTGAVRAALDQLDSALTSALEARAAVGAKLQRLTLAKDKLDAISLGLQELLSKTEDTDIAEAMMHFTQQETMYRAALQAAARVLPMSLLDYLG